ncbi:MAG: tetratricopeptide repeat protein [Deltaproteobacteria bacterium]|nr:tetratricopeptide repeat protein [Deltaproteobacteria bacterium]
MSDLGQTLEALKNDPASTEAASAVRKRAREDGALRDYAEAFAERGRLLLERGLGDEAIASMIEAAQVYEEELEDVEAAAALYSRVLDVRGDHRRALFALGLLLYDLGRFDDLIDLYRRRLALTNDEGETTTLYLYIAEILSERLGNQHRAFQEVMKAARLSPRNLRIIDRLESLGDRTNRLDEVAVVIGDLILHQTDPRVRAALSMRLGQLFMGRLKDPSRALACFRAALVDDGGNPEILGSLDELFREAERFHQLAELLEELTHDRRTAPHQLRLWRELARIYERELQDHKRALAAIVRAVKASSEDRELLDEVLRLGLAAGELNTVATTFAEAAAQTTNPLLRIYLRLKLGHLLGVVLDRPEEAAEAYRAILAQDPEHKEARRRLAKIYERLKRWTRLVLLLEEEADHSGSQEEELEALKKIQDVQKRYLEDDEGLRARIARRMAELEAETVLAPKPALPSSRPEPVLRAVRTPAKSVFDDIRESTIGVATNEPTENADGVGPESETEFAKRAPRLEADPFGAIEVDEIVGAINTDAFLGADEPSEREYDPAAEGSPPIDRPIELAAPTASLVGLHKTGTEELEAFPPPDDWRPGTAIAPPDTSSPVHVTFHTEEIPVGSIIPVVRGERLEAKPGKAPRPSALPPPEWPPREISAPVVGQPVPASAEPPLLDPRLLKPVELDDPIERRAPDAPARPSQSPTVAKIKMARVPASAAKPSTPPPPRVSAPPPARSSVPAAPRLSVVPSAPATYSAPPVRASVPPPAAPSVPPEDASPKLVELAQALADATRRVDVQTQIDLLEEIVALHSDRGEADRALVAAMRLVRLSPNEERVRRLLALSARAEAEAAVLDLYDEVSSRLDLDAQVRLGSLVAEMEAGALSRKKEAVLRLKRLFELAPDSFDVFDRMTALYAELGAHRELALILETEGRRTNDPTRAKDFLGRAAQVREVSLSDPHGAANAILTIVERFPDDLSARSEVVRLLDAAGRYEDEVYFLESDVYARPPADRGALRRRIAHLELERLGKPEAAERALRQALAEDPDDASSLRMLVDLLEREQAWAGLADALATLVELMSDPGLRVEMRKKLAEVGERRLKRPELAHAALAAVIEEAPTDIEALTTLERLERAAGRWEEVAHLVELRARAQADPKDRARVLLEVAELRARELGDDAGASRALKGAVSLAPNDPNVLRAFSEHAARTDDGTAEIEALQDLAIVVDAEDRPAIHARIARIYEQRGRLDDALVELEIVLEARPADREALTGLIAIRHKANDHLGAAKLEDRLAALTDDPRERARLFVAAAESYRAGGDSDSSLKSLEAAAEAQPNDAQILAALGRQNLSAGRSASAIASLGAAAKLLEKSDLARAVELHIGAAEAAERAQRFGEAKKHYEDALLLVPMARKALARLAVLMESAKDHARAFELSAALLLHHEDALGALERKDLYLRMARTKRAMDESEAAVRFARKAVDVAPELVEPLVLLAESLADVGQSEEAARTYEHLIGLVEADDEKRRFTLAAARLYIESGKDPKRATQLLGDRFARFPHDQQVAEMLARAAERAGDPKRAAHALAEAARTADPDARVELLLRAAGRILASDRSLAKQWLVEALADAPRDPAAFSTLASLLENDKELIALGDLHEHTGLAFMKELERVGKDHSEADTLRTRARAHLDTAIDLFRFHVARPESALALLDRRKSLEQPVDESKWLEARAELLDDAAAEGGPDADAKKRRALETWAELLERSPGHVTALRRLFALATELRQPRAAQIYADVLVALDEATKEEKRLFEVEAQADPPPPSNAKNVEIPQIWEDGPLFDLLKELGHAPLIAMSDALAEPRPKKRDKLELSSLAPSLARSFFDASSILGKELPPVYARYDSEVLITPSWVDGHVALILSPTQAEKENAAVLRFEIAHALTLLAPRFLAVVSLPVDVLREGIEGLVRDRLGDESLYSDPKRSKKRGKALDKALPDERREWIVTRAEKWLRDTHRVSLSHAKDVAYRNAERAALVAAGSVHVATENLAPKDRRWFFPLVEFACTRLFVSLAGK